MIKSSCHSHVLVYKDLKVQDKKRIGIVFGRFRVLRKVPESDERVRYSVIVQ